MNENCIPLNNNDIKLDKNDFIKIMKKQLLINDMIMK